MNSEISNVQSDWLAQVDNVNDSEAAQVNGGASVESSIQAFEELYTQVLEANIRFHKAKLEADIPLNKTKSRSHF